MFFLKGLLIGFAIAAPVGPIGVLCIRRSFAEGRAAGFATGLGAATADAMYGAVAAFGLTAISSFLLGWQHELRVFGGLALCALGVKTLFDKVPTQSLPIGARGLAGAYATTVVLTATNPATILSFLAVFAGAGLGQQGQGALSACMLVLGVFAGSAAWWLLLSTFVDRWRRRYPGFASMAPSVVGGAVVAGVTLGVAAKYLKRVNLVAGALLVAFGLAVLLTAGVRGSLQH